MTSKKKLNIFLINLPNSGAYLGYAGATYFPLGIGYIAAVLRKDGHNVKIADLQTAQSLGVLTDLYIRDLLRGYKYDVLCIGGVFFILSALNKVVAYSRQLNPDIPIVVGGTFATRNYRILLQEIPQIDIIVLGEGEITIVEVLDRIGDKSLWKDIPGVAFSMDQIITTSQRAPIPDLDKVPFPARDLLPFNAQYKKAFFQDGPGRYCAHIIGSRGCPYRCVFCEPIFGRRPRLRSADNILSEMDFLMKKYNVKFFRFYDEMFMGGSKAKVRELCQKIIDRKLPIFWWCMTNANLVDKGLLRMMKGAGCTNIAFGLESASGVILKEMDKNCNLQHHLEMVKYCGQIGIKSALAWLTGTFSETKETLEESKAFFIAANRYQYRPSLLNKVVPLPGTRLFDQALERGKIANTVDYLRSFEAIDAASEGSWNNIPNLTNIDSAEFNSMIARVKNEIIEVHSGNYSIGRRLLNFLGLDHVNWQAAFKNFGFSDIRPLFEAMVWGSLSRRGKILRHLCEIIIFGKTSNPKPLSYKKE